MKFSIITILISLITTPSFARYEIIYPVKDINFVTTPNKPVEPPVVPPVEPPECAFTYGGTTEWILFAKKINDNTNYGNRIWWKGKLIFDTMSGNGNQQRITSVTVNGYIYTLDEYKIDKSYSSGSSGIWYHYHSLCRQPV